jgi:hypothetical protein
MNEQGMEQYNNTAHELYETAVADQPREGRAKVDTDAVSVASLEGLLVALMKVNQDGQYLARQQGRRLNPSGLARHKKTSHPFRLKHFAKFIYEVK